VVTGYIEGALSIGLGGVAYVSGGEVASSIIVSAGSEYVSAGGVAFDTAISAGGIQEVRSGGRAFYTTVSSGAPVGRCSTPGDGRKTDRAFVWSRFGRRCGFDGVRPVRLGGGFPARRQALCGDGGVE
jgi:autotransporter passenger strand-loop-strand repeat protein